MFSPAVRPVTSTSMLSGSRVASASIGDGVQLVVRDRVRRRLTDDDDRHLDGGLLAAADEQQVDVLVRRA